MVFIFCLQGKVYLCAANDHLVTILEWRHERGDFVLRNKFSTDQPTKVIFWEPPNTTRST